MLSSTYKLSAAILFSSLMLLFGAFAAHSEDQADKTTADAKAYPVFDLCEADADWITNPTLPDEVDGDTFCDFYKFSWQAFYYMTSPTSYEESLRNFEDVGLFPILQDRDSCAPHTPGEHKVFVRTTKQNDNTPEFVLPEAINQAGAGSTIYDQNGNVVYYSMSFSRDICVKAASEKPEEGNLPENAIELKFAWRILLEDKDDPADFITIKGTITDADADSASTYTLGLVGFHMALSTPNHPAMVWASFEHDKNAPNCVAPKDPTATAWSFTSQACSACLASPTSDCMKQCALNTAPDNSTATTGTATEICRLYPTGTAPEDHKAQTNIDIINQMNAQLTGEGGLVDKTVDPASPQAVLANYRMLGAQWLSDPSIGSNPTIGMASNQRGSLVLENPVMETTFQGQIPFVENGALQFTLGNEAGATNCFTCHEYTPGNTAAVTESSNRNGLSHIYGEIIEQLRLAEEERAEK